MLDIIRDKDSIKFTDGKRVNLQLLKNQIDRRILKISVMVGNFDAPIASDCKKKRTYCETSCQASIENESIFIDFSQCSDKVLNKLNSNQLYAHDNRINRLKYRQKTEQSSYLIMRDSNFEQVNNSMQSCKEEKTERDQPSVESSRLEATDHLNLDLSNIKFDDNISYEEQANELKHYIRSTLSNRKKFSMTDRSKIEAPLRTKTQRYMIKKQITDFPERQLNRIIVSKECLNKKQSQVMETIKQKRLYQTDNKVRANLLKKMGQKFKNDIL